MSSTPEEHYDLPVLRPNSIYLPSHVLAISTESSIAPTPQEEIANSVGLGRFCRRRRICGRLKRLITKNSSSYLHPRVSDFSSVNANRPTINRSICSGDVPISTTSPPSPNEERVNRSPRDRSRCTCRFPTCLSGSCDTFARSLGRFTGRRVPNENLFVLSMIQLLCGLAAVVLSGVAVTKLVFLYQMATGLWAGFLMLATGFHGILTARRRTPRTLISLLIFCVLVTISACLLACVSVAGLIEDGLLRSDASLNFLMPPNTPPYFFNSQGSLAASNIRLDVPLISLASYHARVDTPRIHQVILHVLLLVIGILEASVSVACSVLCCKQLCPSESNTPLSAISYLQNRGATLVPGGTEFLLAVAADPNRPPPALLDYAIPQPDLHPSAQHFLPRPGRRAIILTQAETGVHALSAAQTIAGLVALQPSEDVQREVDSHESSPANQAGVVSRRFGGTDRGGVDDPTPSRNAQRRAESQKLSARLSILLPQLISSESNQRSSLLYVLSSPSASDPPIIFPPFPPAYCLDEESGALSHHQLHPQALNMGPILPSPPSNTAASEPTGGSGRRRRFRWRGRGTAATASSSAIFGHFRRSHAGQTRPMSRRNPNAQAVGLIGDRVLQPVLVVEDDEDSQEQQQQLQHYQSDSEARFQLADAPGSTPPPPSYYATLAMLRPSRWQNQALPSTPEFLPPEA